MDNRKILYERDFSIDGWWEIIMWIFEAIIAELKLIYIFGYRFIVQKTKLKIHLRSLSKLWFMPKRIYRLDGKGHTKNS